MALTTIDLKKLNSEIFRVLKPGGINIYTVRHTNDGDFQNGIYLGEDLYENDGFIVHYFSKENPQGHHQFYHLMLLPQLYLFQQFF